MKTIKEWYEQLPDGYRERALENLYPIMTDERVESLHKAIKTGFVWVCNKEGADFWYQVYHVYKSLDRLPPLPKPDDEEQKR